MGKNPYTTQIDALVGSAPIKNKWSTLAEAKGYVAAIRQLKKELGIVKKELVAGKHQVHAEATNKRNHVGKGFTGEVMRSMFGAGKVGTMNSTTKNYMRNQELKTLQPYEEAEKHLAQVLINLDKLKLEIETWIARQSR